MPKQKIFQRLEGEIATAIKPVLRELRLVDASDYIAYLHFGQHQHISDIFVSSTEQFFAPGFLGYREAGTATVSWSKLPLIRLEAGLSTPNATYRFAILMEDEAAYIEMLAIDRPESQQSESLDEIEELRRAIGINKVGDGSNP